MKITIYELLGLIKDGKAPKKIKYRGNIYIYRNNDGNLIYQYEDSNSVLTIQCFEKLNDEIEIIEDNKINYTYKIIKDENGTISGTSGQKYSLIEEVEDKEYEDIEEIGFLKYCENEVESILHRKIDALIRNQKKILEQLNKEEI